MPRRHLLRVRIGRIAKLSVSMWVRVSLETYNSHPEGSTFDGPLNYLKPQMEIRLSTILKAGTLVCVALMTALTYRVVAHDAPVWQLYPEMFVLVPTAVVLFTQSHRIQRKA